MMRYCFRVEVEAEVHGKLPEEIRETTGVYVPFESPQPAQIMTIGGDGLLLYVSTLFQKSCPPILPIAGGSLGFLTPHSKSSALSTLLSTSPSPTSPPTKLTLRMRLFVRITSPTSPPFTFNVLNECSLHRTSDYLTSLNLSVNSSPFAPVQADGIIFATPTGSTAYSMAAGSSVVHPGVAGIVVQPICPHVLSFRGMVFPDYAVIEVTTNNNRGGVEVAFDGRERRVLEEGERLEVRMSKYPVATVCNEGDTDDWVRGLSECFGFNRRKLQGED
ncbi:hypothetical protein TrST_g8148 [Triparma strigata]|uniref:NAD kinase n=1 Tax=Triparma strigata TaxID=1606541 RepID=A0A9W7EHD9_9STRA|nr:hypothetical protein TrST_g8148 [Triparma strigata]